MLEFSGLFYFGTNEAKISFTIVNNVCKVVAVEDDDECPVLKEFAHNWSYTVTKFINLVAIAQYFIDYFENDYINVTALYNAKNVQIWNYDLTHVNVEEN